MVIEASHFPMTDTARERVAEHFRALAEPTRLRILERLFASPASVGEILGEVGGTQANVSKHLGLLYARGLVARRREGTRTVYSIADPTLKRICSIVCGEVERSARNGVAALLGESVGQARRRAGEGSGP